MQLVELIDDIPKGEDYLKWVKKKNNKDRLKFSNARSIVIFLEQNKDEELKALDLYLQERAQRLAEDYVKACILGGFLKEGPYRTNYFKNRGFSKQPYKSKYFLETIKEIREGGYDLLEASLSPLVQKGFIRHNEEYASDCSHCYNLMKVLWSGESKDRSLAWMLTEIYKEVIKKSFDTEKIFALAREARLIIDTLVGTVDGDEDNILYIRSTPSLSHLLGKEITLNTINNPLLGEIVEDKKIKVKHNKKKGKPVNSKGTESDLEARPILTKEEFCRLMIYLDDLYVKLMSISNPETKHSCEENCSCENHH